MPFQVDFRPKTLDEVVGNESVKASISKALARKKNKVHSFLFTGPPGCGKTTFARVIKEMLGIAEPDFYEYNAANTRGIDTIRDIRENAPYKGMGGDKKLYLLDECHRLTIDALNALLKLLEEPPKHCYFVMATAEPEQIKPKIRKTFSRRCHEYEVSLLRQNELMKVMKSVLIKVGEKPQPYIPLMREIVKVAEGSPGQALKLLDESYELDLDDGIELIERIVKSESTIKELVKMLLDKRQNKEAKWPKIQQMIKDLEGDPEQIRYAIGGYLNAILLSRGWSHNCAVVASYFTDSFMYTGKVGLTLACYFINFGENQDDVPF